MHDGGDGPSIPVVSEIVLEGLRDPERGVRRAQAVGLTRRDLAEATEVFTNSGVQGLSSWSSPERWVSWGVHIPLPIGERPSKWRKRLAEFVSSLRGAAKRWLSDDRVSGFYFMNKPPGMRLRLETVDPDGTRRTVERWLRLAGMQFERQSHDPEEFQFGGRVGMRVARDHFTWDSLAALRVMELELTGSLSVPVAEISLLCIGDLVWRLSEDPAKAWSLWSHLRLTGRLASERSDQNDGSLRELIEYVRPLIFERDVAIQELERPERALVRAYEKQNETNARNLCQAAMQGQLMFGIPEIVPFWIIFHWNRWGLDPATQMALALARISHR